MEQNKFGFQPNLSEMEGYLKDNVNNTPQTDGPTWWTLPTGTSAIRILPPWDATGRVALAVYSHPIEYQGKGMKYKKYSWTCVNRTFGKPCNICQGLDSIRESGVDVSEYEPNRRTFYLNAIVIHDPDYDRDIKSGKKPEDCSGVAPGTHVLMRAPKTLYDWIVSNITNPMVGDITSVTNGIDIFVTREGSGLGTTYTPTTSPNGRQPVPQEYLDKIESLYDLDSIFSTGFEQEQVDDLVSALRKSSTAFNNGIQNVANQMSGYQVPPQQPQQYQPQQPQTPMQGQIPGFGAPNTFAGVPNPQVAPQQNPNVGMSPQMTPPWETQGVPSPQPTPQGNPDTPPCFGKEYSASNVKCVTCSHEIPCSQEL